MMLVSWFSGLVCRRFCSVDETGYVITNKSSVFKVNYTRKMQHFAAYLIPLLKPSSGVGHGGGGESPLETAWGSFFTMIGFLVLIKPIRERFDFFMLQFNSLDRPEDRPNTLQWIVAGNIAPGMVLLLLFRWLFSSFPTQSVMQRDDGSFVDCLYGSSDLVYVILFITAIGDGLAEPVGIAWGKHKYYTYGIDGESGKKKRYTRSWEGSACVFLSGMVFPLTQYHGFGNLTQLVVSMVVLPPLVAYAEATAPHTMDTPVLMVVTGLVLCAVVHLF